MITLEELEKLYLTRQSCRSFDANRKVEHELLERICKLALLSPSACNTQPWKLYVVTGDMAKEAIKATQDMGKNKFASDAPAIIVLGKVKGNAATRLANRFDYNDFENNDIGILTAHLVLAAEAAGLQTCILGWRNEKKLCQILSLPKGTRLANAIVLGYATQGYEVRTKKRKDASETLIFVNDAK